MTTPTDADKGGKIIIHRDFEGDHNTDSDDCWCRPIEMEADDLRDVEQIVEEANALDG